jgi:glycosyltransferase involved in cell wall biosynthesis
MRIAVWHNMPSGGGQRALYDHVRGLVARRHHVEIWAPPTADTSLLDLSSLAPYHQVPLGTNRYLDIIPELRELALGADIRAMDAHCQKVAAQIGKLPFDVLLSGTCLWFGAPRVARWTSLPSVLYLQEPCRRLYEAPSVWALGERGWDPDSLARAVFRFVRVQRNRKQVREEIANAGTFDTILVNSRFSAESLARSYGKTSRVCYLGIDADLWDNDSPEREHLVVGIGEFNFRKGIDFVIDAVGAMRSPRPEVHWIGNRGNGKYLAQLRTQAERLNVRFTPHLAIPQAEMAALLRRASVLAYAPRLEPFGYAPLECAAAGLPTVAVAEGGVRETVQDGVTGVLVDRDVAAMSEALTRVLEDPVTAREMGDAAKKWVSERWALEDAVTRLERELHRTAGQGHAPRTPG